MTVHSNCLLCQSSNLKKLRRYYNSHHIVKCQDCGFVFIEKVPSEEELKQYYSIYSYAEDRPVSPVTIKRYQKLLKEFEIYRNSNQILEIGCGKGDFLLEARKNYWEVQGTELSERGAQLCIDKGIKTHYGTLREDLFPSNYFDVIIAIEVIEHINNPRELIYQISRFLRRGGLFYCTTPNFNSIVRYILQEKYSIIHYPEHLCYYTPKTLRELMVKNGFLCKKVETTGIDFDRLFPKKELRNLLKVDNEKIRIATEKNSLLNFAKRAANFILATTSLGGTIRGYFIKGCL
ncbi:MAG: class I SAM-dependent methyltransferase [Thermosynechococcus sp. Uc]|uniref:class I SAM-dependent methyltransferase n=1 Tax=Thermosynechococcus sp. Uc TaxID=3034853 RepID=UPI001A0F2F31|nr:class I SAM-dependent methyltransferase [Thermosynechococcus sp. Uc]MDM7327078.1 class I SAM-dependent methyltransferase [Thermosynechococcus sp. Uc]HIK26379.1 class I SAM-dependent methyltransferase [Thermosynechococcus sp. M46_R2017_013]